MAKKERCQFCEDELTQITADNTDKLLMEIYPGKVICCFGYFQDQSEETIEAMVEIPMFYCPRCGRKLI